MPFMYTISSTITKSEGQTFLITEHVINVIIHSQNFFWELWCPSKYNWIYVLTKFTWKCSQVMFHNIFVSLCNIKTEVKCYIPVFFYMNRHILSIIEIRSCFYKLRDNRLVCDNYVLRPIDLMVIPVQLKIWNLYTWQD